MNRQLRRAQEKAEEKQAREKKKVKAAKRAKREQRRAKRTTPKAKTKANAKPAKRRPDLFFRFAGPITLFTTAFIVLQAVAPRPEGDNTFGLVVEVAYYFIFGYGLCLWLAKQGRANARWIAAGVAVVLAVGLQLGVFLVPTLAPNLLLLAVGSALGVLGALAGDWVAKRMM